MSGPAPSSPRGGVYAITNTLNGKQYIGSTRNFRRRWNDHRNRLARTIHGNPRLQRAWNKYGAEAFVFVVLEQVADVADLTYLVAREQHYMDARFASTGDKGYNSRLKAENNEGARHSAESRARMAARRLGRRPSLATVTKRAASNMGKRRTPEQIARVRAARLANSHRITASSRNSWLASVGQELFSAIRSLPDDAPFKNPWQFAGILAQYLPWYSREALDRQIRRLQERGVLDENGRPLV